MLKREAVREELAMKSPLLFNVVYWFIRVVAPIGVDRVCCELNK